MTLAGVEYQVVVEEELSGTERAAIGELLGDAFSTDDAEQDAYLRAQGHWGDAPIVRVLALRDGIVGQISLFRMGAGVMGLGDIAVAPSSRGRGIARALVARALSLCDDDVVLTRTVLLRELFADHGFEPVRLAQLVPDPNWLGRGDLARIGELELHDV